MVEIILALGLWAAMSVSHVLPPVPTFASSASRTAETGSETAPVFLAPDRSVSNWREATRQTLEPVPLAMAAAYLDSGRPVVTRCVKLNNPWCIKRAGWTGELGGDGDGHTAFSSTEAGADAAASLLRTYYVTYGQRSAQDIVRRWAPAECRIGDGSGLPALLAVRGLANTLRGRYLASRTRKGAAQPRSRRAKGAPSAQLRVSSIPLAPMPSYRVPDIAAGMGERPARLGRTLPKRAAVAATTVPVPAATASLSCGSEEGRIGNYAQAIAKALGVEPSRDLQLFDGAGQPTSNLLPVMVAMSAIELGYLHAGPELVERAIDRLRVRIAQAALPAAMPAPDSPSQPSSAE